MSNDRFNMSKFFLDSETARSHVHQRIATSNQYDDAHGKLIYEYLEKEWLIPSTPIYTNSGTTRGLPISCYVNSMEDSMVGFRQVIDENIVAGSLGGGIGSYMGNVRPLGFPIKDKGTTSGVVPFMKSIEIIASSVSQAGFRRGAASVYLPIWHPEIEAFIRIRKPDLSNELLKTPTLHHGVCIDDEFMHCLRNGTPYRLRFKDQVVKTISPHVLWEEILRMRTETGEPYILFTDNVKRGRCETYEKLDLDVTTSNLCSEIMLTTNRDHLNKPRSAVCCISSLNLAKYDAWKNDAKFIHNVCLFLDRVLENFLNYAPDAAMENFKYAVSRERSIALSVLGFSTYLQSNGIPFESEAARNMNLSMFKYINFRAKEANVALGLKLGRCPDSIDADLPYRFTNMMALAPTFSVSNIAEVSPSIEPWVANVYLNEMTGNKFMVKNNVLYDLLRRRGMRDDDITHELILANGSAKNISLLSEHDKEVFKIAREIDQSAIVTLASDRTPYIDQGQSINLFLNEECTGQDISDWHIQAWKGGVKSLYYVRSMANNHDTKLSLLDQCVLKDNVCQSCQ